MYAYVFMLWIIFDASDILAQIVWYSENMGLKLVRVKNTSGPNWAKLNLKKSYFVLLLIFMWPIRKMKFWYLSICSVKLKAPGNIVKSTISQNKTCNNTSNI